MPDITLRHLADDDPDIPAVLTLIQNSFAFMDGRIDPPSSMHLLTVDAVRRHAREAEIWTLGAPPIACVFLTPKPGRLYLGKLAVAAGHRGRGLARILVDKAVLRAREMNLPVVELQTRIELTENQTAFERMGFLKFAESAHPGYDRPTSITYRKDVT